MKKVLAICLCLFVLVGGVYGARKALLIGNAKYGSKDKNLKNPINDLQLLEQVLKNKGFAVSSYLNANNNSFRKAVRAFGESLQGTDEILFYFSGHGSQVSGINYLIPVNANIVDEYDCETEAVSANWVLQSLSRADMGVFILDACRNNPYQKSKSEGSRGLAAMKTSTPSQFIIFATEYGELALDGTGNNSPFVEALVNQIASSELQLMDMLPLIKQEVLKKTNNKQSPTAYGILTKPFYFTLNVPIEEKRTTEVKRKTQTVIEYGSLELSSKLDGEVWIDGYFVGTVSPDENLVIHDLAVGDHIIELRNGANISFRFVEILKDDLVSVQIDFDLEGMVFVKGGTFMMGSSEGNADEKPAHQVILSSFYIGKYEVTQAEYQEIMRKNPSRFKDNPNNPVDNVSWFNAIEYCNRRSMKEDLNPCYNFGSYGRNPDKWPSNWYKNPNNHTKISCDWSADGYRLPTEAEWEFAAKGGTESKHYKYSGSNSLVTVAWYQYNSQDGSHRVGTKAPNELGIHDMSGNVSEWCWDIFANYTKGTQTNPHGASKGDYRVLRDGAWDKNENYCRVSLRNIQDPNFCYYTNGFRIVRVIQ